MCSRWSEREGRRDEWEGFSFHLHKECRIKAMRQVLPPKQRSERSSHCQRDSPPLLLHPITPPPHPVFFSPVSFFAGGLRKRSVGRNYFGIADSAVGTAFLRASAKMAEGLSNCGRAPPRPGSLLKTQEGGRGSQTQQTAAVPRTQLS